MAENALVLSEVSKSFREVVAVNDLSLTIPAGTIFGLLGPNGSGKTTTLRMILTILLPDRGDIRLWGKRPADLVRERVGYLPEERGLYPKMRVHEHLVYLAELHGVPRRVARDRATRWLADRGLAERARHTVEELSKGQQQTVQLIASLIHEPDLVVLDEPFAGLDPVNVSGLRDLIRRLRDDGKTILLSTHRMEQVEQLCDDICLMARGNALLTGNLRDAKRRFARGAVTLAMDGAPDFPSAVTDADIVVGIERRDDGMRVQLRREGDARELLRRALERGRVVRFEQMEPSLDEIFVEMVANR